MSLGAIKLPGQLLALIEAGRWPRDQATANLQNLRSLVAPAAIRAVAPEESAIFLYSPPFHTIRDELIGGHGLSAEPRLNHAAATTILRWGHCLLRHCRHGFIRTNSAGSLWTRALTFSLAISRPPADNRPENGLIRAVVDHHRRQAGAIIAAVPGQASFTGSLNKRASFLWFTQLPTALGNSVARYFSHSEITSRQLPSTKDIRWLAGQISALPPFVSGSAVLCGSVAWGTHLARSDIDVAHFGTTKHPQIERDIEEVVARFQKRTHDNFIAPRVDIITIGIEPEARAAKTSSHSITDEPVAPAGASMAGVFVLNRAFPAVFADTFVRFVDHIGSLAHLKAGPWKEFMKSYLSPQREDYRTIQREGIRSYVATTTTSWEEQPLHRLNRDADRELTQRQLDLAGQAENYPVNLMRRILGEMALYPRPDRATDVRRQFEKLTQPWAKRLMADSAPFLALHLQYDAIIADARKVAGGLTAADYQERLSALFEALPFGSIQEAVWEYLDHT